ncbi:SMP-30/gluconolactonase/LRE family protein [Streptomyces sp. NPDC006458]|uniref:SMP-30/gluconolactonase/LRE family protein n=1 Tax=Streptomyces sp. NPDC006458 TaxID=3154302 RepID=UPI0033AB2426
MQHLSAVPCGPVPGRLTEGPVWDQRSQELLWVDITAGLFHRGSLGTRGDGTGLPDVVRRTTLALDSTVGAVHPCRSGATIAAVGTSIQMLSLTDGRAEEVATAPLPADGIRRRFNDAGCDPRGRLLVGTMATDVVPGAGALYLLEPQGLRVLMESVTVSNGLAWSPCGQLLYYADSATGRVDVFDYDLATATPSRRRPFVEVSGGVPDGLTVDRDGSLWVAIWGAGQVRAYASDGTAHTQVSVPASQVSSVTFAGPRLDILIITTAAEGLTRDERRAQPDAGRLFVCRPGSTGLPAVPFDDLTRQEIP